MSAVTILRSVGGLVFDATFKESHSLNLEITDTPVESGVTISDHAYMKPLRVTIEAGVSDTPLAVSDSDQFKSESGRSKRAFVVLKQLQKNAEPFAVQTGLALYNNMLVSSIEVEQTVDSENVLDFICVLREVIIVGTAVVTYPPRAAGPTANQADEEDDDGEQQSEAASEKPTTVVKALIKAEHGGGG